MAFRFDKLTVKAQEAVQRAHGQAQDYGNPQLQPMRAWNYDLSAEWYMSDSNSLTGAVFDKEISGFLASTTPENMLLRSLPQTDFVYARVKGLPDGVFLEAVRASQPLDPPLEPILDRGRRARPVGTAELPPAPSGPLRRP